MVGAGALREALQDPDVEAVLSIGRRPCGVTHPKLRELLLDDLFDIAAGRTATRRVGRVPLGGRHQLGRPGRGRLREGHRGSDAALGAHVVAAEPALQFLLLLGRGRRRAHDVGARAATGRRRDCARCRLQHAGCVRPAFIQPGPGIRSRVQAYQILITIFGPIVSARRSHAPFLVHHHRAPRPRHAARRPGPRRQVHPRGFGHQSSRRLSVCSQRG